MIVRNPQSSIVCRSSSKQQEYRAEQGESAAATLEERVFESEPAVQPLEKPGRPLSSTDHTSLFTVDLLGGWCKP